MRKFGIEIETINFSPKETRKILKKELDLTNWKFIKDNTVCCCLNYECSGVICKSCEIISPILTPTKETFALIQNICEILNKNKFSVNQSCGFHVHIDAKDLNFSQSLNIFEKYFKYETIIDKFHHLSRRNDNIYCVPLSTYSEILNSRSLDNFDKYCKLNLMSLMEHNTIEFRQHHGTIDYDEIYNWINFCLQFVEINKNKNNNSLFHCMSNSIREFYEQKLFEF